MTDVKRPAENGSAGGELVKRQKTENGAIVPGRAQPAEVSASAAALQQRSSQPFEESLSSRDVLQGPKRTSDLHAPTMLLTGHGAEVFTCKFSPDGQSIASGSHDKHIFLWRVYGEECENYMLLKGKAFTRTGLARSSALADAHHGMLVYSHTIKGIPISGFIHSSDISKHRLPVPMAGHSCHAACRTRSTGMHL